MWRIVTDEKSQERETKDIAGGSFSKKPISARIPLPSACVALKSKFRHFNKTSIVGFQMESRPRRSPVARK